jgi:hypothetical protein
VTVPGTGCLRSAGLTLAPSGGKIDPERSRAQTEWIKITRRLIWRPELTVVSGRWEEVACVQPGDRSTVPERF